MPTTFLQIARDTGMTQEEFTTEVIVNYAALVDVRLDGEDDGAIDQTEINTDSGYKIVILTSRLYPETGDKPPHDKV